MRLSQGVLAGDYEGALNEYRDIISQDQNKATIKIVECNIQLCCQFLGIPSYNNSNENLQTTQSDSQKKFILVIPADVK